MLRNINKVWVFFTAGALMLSACGAPRQAATPTVDPNSLLTAAVLTVNAELTRSAALTPSATITPTPTLTPSPTTERTAIPTQPATTATLAPATQAARPDQAEYISQSVADNTKLPPGSAFTLVWKMKNVGTTTWTTNYLLRHFSGDTLGAPGSVNFPREVKPGEQVELTVNMKAPMTPGSYQSTWVLTNDQGVNFFPVYIIVESAGNPVPSATVTSSAPVETATLEPTAEPTEPSATP